MTRFSEAEQPSQLFRYYLLDTTGFQPNVFTSVVPGINDTAIAAAANAASGGLPAVGAVRIALEPKPGLPTNPDDPRDPDRTEATNPAQTEKRLRIVPSAVDLEVLYDVFLRSKSFRPDVADTAERFFLAYAHQVAKVDKNGDGVIS